VAQENSCGLAWSYPGEES